MSENIFPLIDVFNPAFDSGDEYIETHLEAACYMAVKSVENALEFHIDGALKQQLPKNLISGKTPKSLADYQQSYPKYSPKEVERDIMDCGFLLSEGQTLFHGGLWPSSGKKTITLNAPFSNSFCPQIALRNAEHKGKAYVSKRIDLMVLRVVNAKTKAFVYKQDGRCNMGHEKEVLFSSGATLTIVNDFHITDKHFVAGVPLCGLKCPTDYIPIHVLEVEIS